MFVYIYIHMWLMSKNYIHKYLHIHIWYARGVLSYVYTVEQPNQAI